jgi:hypothetical protein
MIDDVLPDRHPRDQIVSASFNTIIVGGSNEVAAKVIYVALLVHQVLLILALNLNALEAFSCEVIRVVNVDDIFFLFDALFNIGVTTILKFIISSDYYLSCVIFEELFFFLVFLSCCGSLVLFIDIFDTCRHLMVT